MKIRKITSWAVACLVLLPGSGIFATESDQSTQTLSGFIKSHRTELETLLAQRKIKPLNDVALQRLLETFTEESPEAQQMLMRLDDLDAAVQGPPYFPRPITNDIIVGCMVRAVNHKDPNVRKQAIYYIYAKIKPSQLRSRVQFLLTTPQNLDSPQMLHVLGRLDCFEANQVLSRLSHERKDFPEEIKARLGNVELERSIINSFLSETNAAKKAELALKVGYIGTPGCVYALAHEMRDPRVISAQGNGYSVRYKILQGLGLALPEIPLFNNELAAVSMINTTPKSNQGGDEYFDKVEKWCETNFNIQWRSPRPPFLLRLETPMP